MALTKEEKAAKAAAAEAAKAAGSEGAESDVVLVEMVRDSEAYPEPHTASVHPDEVENYASVGWVSAD